MSDIKHVSADLKVHVTGDFFDPDTTEETLRYAVEQCLEDSFDDVDVRVDKDINVHGKWINVKDRLPEEKINQYTQDYQEILCVLKTRFGTDVRVYKYGKGHFLNGPQEIDTLITYWMPFPEPPKEVIDGDE